MAESVGTSKKSQQKKAKPRPRGAVKQASGHFGAALRKMREDKGMLLRNLAAHLKVSLPYLSDVERGRREPLSNDRIMSAALMLEGDALHLIEQAIRDRGFLLLDIDDDDALRVKAAMMLTVAFPKAADEVVAKIVSVLKAAS
jgi:transcriptional regulator with XRE-family HTH domain